MGWLLAVPNGWEQSRMESGLEADNPDLSGDEYIFSYFTQIGMRRELTYGEVSAWSELTATYITPFISETLVSMSAAFHHYLAASRDPNYPHPWQTKDEAKSLASARNFSAI